MSDMYFDKLIKELQNIDDNRSPIQKEKDKIERVIFDRTGYRALACDRSGPSK